MVKELNMDAKPIEQDPLYKKGEEAAYNRVLRSLEAATKVLDGAKPRDVKTYVEYLIKDVEGMRNGEPELDMH